MTRPVAVLAACRTAVVPRGGAFRPLDIHQLAAPVVQECLRRAQLPAEVVDELVASNSLGAGGNPARLIALAAGLPERVGGMTIDRQCCGGLDTLLVGQALIASGAAEVVCAGGAESFSRRPLRYRTATDDGEPVAYDRPPFSPWPDRDPEMHEAASALAERFGIDRAEQDAWAVASHRKALEARDTLAAEIVYPPGTPVTHDPFARGLSDRLCARAPVIAGSITLANCAVEADAAAFVILAAERVATRAGTEAARLLGGATVGGPPEHPGLAPVPAIARTLDQAGHAADDLAAAEIMEAYAVQAIACVRQSGLDPAIVNPAGGALARGHPIGASGAVLAVRAFQEVRARKGPVLAAIAAAGGLGTAAIFAPA